MGNEEWKEGGCSDQDCLITGKGVLRPGKTTCAECGKEWIVHDVQRRRLPSLNNDATSLDFLWYAGMLAQIILVVLVCYTLWVYRCKESCLSIKTMKRRVSDWSVCETSRGSEAPFRRGTTFSEM